MVDAQGRLTVKIKEKPIGGAANAYLIKFSAKEFNPNKSDILLKKGENSRFKKLLLNIEAASFNRIISRCR